MKEKQAANERTFFRMATFWAYSALISMFTNPREMPPISVKSLSTASIVKGDLSQGGDWATPLTRVLKVRLPYAMDLHTLAGASTLLTSFPLHSDSGIGHARLMIFAALLSGDLSDVEKATCAMESVIRNKGLR